MRYEELRNQYQQYIATNARKIRLQGRAKSGKLSVSRLVACKQEITRLEEQIEDYERLWRSLEQAADPAWRKLSRELDAAMAECSNPDHNPISTAQMVRKLFDGIVLLFAGTWVIDRLRHR